MKKQSSSDRAKFSYVKYSDIQKYIDSGKIDANDIIYTTDTHENIVIGADLSINSIRSKIYTFPDTSTAESKLNSSTDTYEGQIVAVLSDEVYVAYIVNKNDDDSFYVTKLSEDAKTLNYDNLGNRPIDNLDGTLSNPIIIADLTTGIYKVRGRYKICKNDPTTYSSANDHLFFVSNGTSEITIREITAKTISEYTVVEDSIVSSAELATKEWVKAQGYITETYVDNKLLDYMTEEEVKDYVKEVIDGRVEAKLNEYLSEADSAAINNLFE